MGNDPQKNDQSPVDLGLSELLKANVVDSLSKIDISTENNQNGRQQPGSQPHSEDDNPLEKLWQRSEFAELVKRVEPDGNSSLSALEKFTNRLWWARAQLKLKAMPVNLLLAALEPVLNDYRSGELSLDDEGSRRLLEHSVEELSTALIQAGNRPTAVKLVELAWQKEPARFADRLTTLVAEELSEAPGRSVAFFEHQDQVAYLEYLKQLTTKISGDRWTFGSTQDNPKRSTNAFKKYSSAAKPRTNKALLLLLLVALIAGGLALVDLPTFKDQRFHALLKPDLTREDTLASIADKSPEVNLPGPEKKQPAPQTALDSVFEALLTEDIEQAKAAGDPGLVPGPKQADTKPITAVPVNDLSLNGPAEPDDVRKLIRDFDQGYATEPLLVDQPGNERPPSIAQGESPGDYIVNGYEKLPGNDELRPKPDSNSKNDGRFYTIMRPASVYSGPSTRARVVGKLERGQSVEVVGVVGAWRRIRSEKGREAYILAITISGL